MTYEFPELVRTFLQEKKYLQNVSPETIVLYETSFKAFYGCESADDLKRRVVELRERGLKPISVNTYLRHMKTYWLWQKKEWELPWLREEQKILGTLSPRDVDNLLKFRQTQGANLRRAHLVAVTILDCGLRASEALGLTKEDVDLDNFVLKVRGKGDKHRLVPFSHELRKTLYRCFARASSPRMFVFGTKNNTAVSVRNFERDLKKLGERIGIARLHPHGLRHTMAVNYLRRGGNLEFLRRILGHNSILTTQRYVASLGVEDLQRVHSELSVLSRR